MIKNFKLFIRAAKNNDGVAIMMVMSTVAIMTVLLAMFTFDTKVNKLKIQNLQDRAQAKLNAEAGLRLTIAKLKLYQQGRNKLEKDKKLKAMIPMNKLEGIITQPFIYPISLPSRANILQKSALQEFEKNNLLQGSMSVSVSPVKGFLNPNNLRVAPKAIAQYDELASSAEDANEESEDGDKKVDAKTKTSPSIFIEKQLTELISSAIEDEKESNPEFEILYGKLDTELLVKELKYFVNDRSVTDEMNIGDVEQLYINAGTTPKHAPLSSISELHLLEGWNDAIIQLVQDRLTVHEVAIIQINEITDSQLKFLFPLITPIQSKDFFKYRDAVSDNEEDQKSGTLEPHPFQSVEEFKTLIVEQLSIIDDEGYKARIDEFEKAGLKLGVAGKIFKVVSKGTFGRAEYTLTAYIDLPVKPSPPPKKKKKPETDDEQDPNAPPTTEANPDKKETGKKEELPMELLPPRIIEIRST